MKPAALAAVICYAIAGIGHAGVVEDANEAMTRAFQAESPTPVLAARNLAILHLAMHDAVTVGHPKRSTFLPHLDAKPPPRPEYAARAAAWTICRALYPGRVADFASLESTGQTTQEKQSFEIGKNLAQAWLEARKDDGSSTTIHYVPKDTPGHWRRTPPALRPPESPHWGTVQPFFLEAPTICRPPAPPALGSAEYARALAEVQRLGGINSQERTAEQTEIARFWSDFSYTSTPPGHWNEIARAISRSRKLSLQQSARLFAMLNATLADTGIAAWDCKYHWNAWRPVTAIRAIKKDGNHTTSADAVWVPLLNTPPHPEYVSGHSAFSAAAAGVMVYFFGSDAISFYAESDSLPGVKRYFRSFSQCAVEIGRSRIHGGIHFGYSNEAGQTLGKMVAAHITNASGLYHRPSSPRSSDSLPR